MGVLSPSEYQTVQDGSHDPMYRGCKCCLTHQEVVTHDIPANK